MHRFARRASRSNGNAEVDSAPRLKAAAQAGHGGPPVAGRRSLARSHVRVPTLLSGGQCTFDATGSHPTRSAGAAWIIWTGAPTVKLESADGACVELRPVRYQFG